MLIILSSRLSLNSRIPLLGQHSLAPVGDAGSALFRRRGVARLYAEADNAVAQGNYNDASLLQSQGDRLYSTLENLRVVIEEQEE